MVLMPHYGGPGHPMGGNERGDSRKIPLSQQGQGSIAYRSSSVALLEISANRWVPTSSIRKVQPDVDTPEMIVLSKSCLYLDLLCQC
jgi:translation initiation factor 4G